MLLAGAAALVAVALMFAGLAGANKQAEFYAGGEPGTPVKIEVFSDYQCPACRTFFLETIKPILENYAGAKTDAKGQPVKPKVSVVYRDLPLEMHQFARAAARYGLAAQRMGRDRWMRVSDALYVQQAQWSLDGNIEAVLSKVLDPMELVRLRKLAADPAIEEALAQEVMLAQSREVVSTPTFFIISETGRQQRVNGPVPYAVMKDYIDRLLR
jgi:protein-disulfide isomerase